MFLAVPSSHPLLVGRDAVLLPRLLLHVILSMWGACHGVAVRIVTDAGAPPDVCVERSTAKCVWLLTECVLELLNSVPHSVLRVGFMIVFCGLCLHGRHPFVCCA